MYQCKSLGLSHCFWCLVQCHPSHVIYDMCEVIDLHPPHLNLPRILEVLARKDLAAKLDLHNGFWYVPLHSILDIRDGFWHMPLHSILNNRNGFWQVPLHPGACSLFWNLL